MCQISGGFANNIIPDYAEAVASFRVSPNDRIDYLSLLRKKLKNVSIKKENDIKPVICSVPKELSFLKKKGVVKYCTELSYYKNGVVLGPGNIGFAHKDNEQISIKELKRAVEVYLKIIEESCFKK